MCWGFKMTTIAFAMEIPANLQHGCCDLMFGHVFAKTSQLWSADGRIRGCLAFTGLWHGDFISHPLLHHQIL